MPLGEFAFDSTKGFVDCKGFFGEYGGFHETNPRTNEILNTLSQQYVALKDNEEFLRELKSLQKSWLGRPTPLYHAVSLSKKLGGAQIYLKREDLGHTGAHKINHCLGEALLAKRMGKSRIITDTASGTHGICLSAAAARMGLECTIYVGENDWNAQIPAIRKMQTFGTKVIKVTTGKKNLKEATDKAFQEFLSHPDTVFYAWSTIAGPQPFPNIVKDFQAIVGEEAKEQLRLVTGRLPNHVVGSVAGGSNALGLFQSFLSDDEVKLYAVEVEVTTDKDSVNLGNPGAGYMENFALLHDINYVSVTEADAAKAFMELSRTEGIMPSAESTHALASVISLAPQCPKDEIILVNLAGRGETHDIQKATKTLGIDFDAEA